MIKDKIIAIVIPSYKVAKHIENLDKLSKRYFFELFIYNFNMASIYMIFRFSYRSFNWYQYITTGDEAITSTVMLSVLPIILGLQFLFQAVSIYIDNVSKKRNG